MKLPNCALFKIKNYTMIKTKITFTLGFRIFILSVLMLVANSLKSQSSVDSLLHVIQSSSKNQKVKTLVSSAYEIRNDNPEEAIKLLLESITISKQSDYKAGLLFSHRLLGNLYLKVNNYEKSINHYEECIEYAKAQNDSLTLRECYVNSGSIYFTQGLIGKSLEYFMQAVNYSESFDKEREYNNLGAVFFSEGEYDEAYKYYNLALEIFKEKKDTYSYLVVLINIGHIFRMTEKYDLALTHYNNVLVGNDTINDDELSIICLNNIGIVKSKTGDSDSAIHYFKKSLEIAENHPDQVVYSRTLFLLGEEYFNRGMLSKAKPYLLKSFEIANKLSIYAEKSASSDLLQQIYTKEGQYKNALYYANMYKQASDSLVENEAKSEIMRLMFEHKIKLQEIDKKEQIERQDAEHRKSVFKFYTVTFILIIVTLLSFIVMYRARQKSKYAKIEKEKAKLEVEKMERELELRNFEVVGKVLAINEKNEFIDSTAKLLDDFSQSLAQTKKTELDAIIRQIREQEEQNQWEEFYFYFTKVYSKFFERLETDFPELTLSEKRLCAFLKLNMTTKDIASLTYLNFKSVEVARIRLRKKLNLTNSNISFSEFFSKYN